ncbi:hypothetical protein PR202_gb04698 [Eleusine coracana subsp. coracana]|uniref:Dof-type domain-containing protein n=1 Tax=Eleusine coracana subsp. coracana TaxID=191504 RepID=A0AAV5E4H4_ELECO|nr:hypothetical protein QOZ80_1BG0083930 [Eleusine coracana subsp. coracana]GJN17617.1 hypothetical protein PR202_gb04698 [Eleusine coracana subsp. coracana]
MLSHVEMAPAAGGFKLFGKVITQCAAPPPPASSSQEPPASRPAAFVRERADPDESDQPTVKREAAFVDFDKQQQQHVLEESKPRSRQQQQHQDTAEARAAAAASSAPPLPCPRCRSRNTKFCYFNNYNVNQPRHFCKDCHRYWTAGGALRNVPVGAGRRKNRPLGPVVAAVPAHAAHHHLQLQHHQHHRAAGFVLGFPGSPSSPTSPPVYADRWPVCPDRRF